MLSRVKTKPKKLKNYQNIISDSLLNEILDLSNELKGLRVLHINATKFGGGVVEILTGLIPLLQDVGIQAGWEVIEGNKRFFDVTKSFHNAFQGQEISLTEKAKTIYNKLNKGNAKLLEGDWDVIVVHDPQPAAIPFFCRKKSNTKYIWRCHIDTTSSEEKMWNFFEPFLASYDSAIFTLPEYSPKSFPVSRVFYFTPAIDPLSIKNRPMGMQKAKDIIRKYGVDPSKPLITQVSRFDPWKDPVGVIKAYRIAKKEFPDLQLALVGQTAADDPEGISLYKKTKDFAADEKGIHFILNPENNEATVNAFQTASNIILQKSTREGFGLTVTEAMFKAKTVIGGNCGAIKTQIVNGESGYLVNSISECAQQIKEILKDPLKAKEIGKKAKNVVKERYLLPRYLRDELLAYKGVMSLGRQKSKA